MGAFADAFFLVSSLDIVTVICDRKIWRSTKDMRGYFQTPNRHLGADPIESIMDIQDLPTTHKWEYITTLRKHRAISGTQWRKLMGGSAASC